MTASPPRATPAAHPWLALIDGFSTARDTSCAPTQALSLSPQPAFRAWSAGRGVACRAAQPRGLPSEVRSPNASHAARQPDPPTPNQPECIIDSRFSDMIDSWTCRVQTPASTRPDMARAYSKEGGPRLGSCPLISQALPTHQAKLLSQGPRHACFACPRVGQERVRIDAEMKAQLPCGSWAARQQLPAAACAPP